MTAFHRTWRAALCLLALELAACTTTTPNSAPNGVVRAAAAPAVGQPGCAEGRQTAYSEAHPLGAGYVDELGSLPTHVAYLTFDDGPSEWTAEFLDILREEGAKATFFVVAQGAKGAAGLDGTYLDAHEQVVTYRSILRRIVDDGHVLGNHTRSHRDLAELDAAAIALELDENERLVNQALLAAGAKPRLLSLLRAPFGSPWRTHRSTDQDAFIKVGRAFSERGLNMLWDIDSTDSREWANGESLSRRPGQVRIEPGAPSYAEKVARIKDSVLGDPLLQAGMGAIMLFHDTHNATRDALPQILLGLRKLGYHFETLEALAQQRWQRASSQLSPGPHLFDRCAPEQSRSCARFPARGGRTPLEVCGRLWRSFERAGGAGVLGWPLSSEEAGAGLPFQRFEHGTLELGFD